MPIELNLYEVGANGRILLGEIAQKGDFYDVDKDDESGLITLSPVKINKPTTRGYTQDALPEQ